MTTPEFQLDKIFGKNTRNSYIKEAVEGAWI